MPGAFAFPACGRYADVTAIFLRCSYEFEFAKTHQDHRGSNRAAGCGRDSGHHAGIVLAALLTGCSGVTVGALPAAGSTPWSSAAPKAASCTPNGSAIPDGHYSGPIKATIKTTMTISGDGISIPNAGGGTEAWNGTIDMVSSVGEPRCASGA
jgi:hypothetical protein